MAKKNEKTKAQFVFGLATLGVIKLFQQVIMRSEMAVVSQSIPVPPSYADPTGGMAGVDSEIGVSDDTYWAQ
jgi:hypothetical protein